MMRNLDNINLLTILVCCRLVFKNFKRF